MRRILRLSFIFQQRPEDRNKIYKAEFYKGESDEKI